MPFELRKTRFITAVAFALVCGAAVLMLTVPGRRTPETQTPRAVWEDVRGKPVASSDVKLGYGTRLAQKYTYKFERNIEIRGLEAGKTELAYHGQFAVDIFREPETRSKDGISEFRGIITAKIAEQPDSPEQDEKVRLRFTMSADGKLRGLFATKAESEAGRQKLAILKDLLAQYAFSEDADTVGRYEAQYELVTGANARWRKFKRRYLGAAGEAVRIGVSRHELRWDKARSVPAEIQGEEETELGAGGELSLSSRSSYRIVLLDAQALGTSDWKAEADEQPEQLALSSAGGAGSEALVRAPMSWHKLVGQLRGLEQLDGGGQLRVFGELVRLLRARPEAAQEAYELLRREDATRLGAGSALFKTVVGALATAGTSQAQSLALKLYEDPSCPVSGKGAILSALTTTQAVLEPETREFLEKVMTSETHKDLAHGGAFALGASLQAAPDGPDKARSIALLRARWESPEVQGNPADRLALLDAIGNSGQTAFLDILETASRRTDDRALRAKAVFGLRLMAGERATGVLAKSLSDADASIREKAAEAIRFRTWDEALREPLLRCSGRDPAAAVREACGLALEAGRAAQ